MILISRARHVDSIVAKVYCTVRYRAVVCACSAPLQCVSGSRLERSRVLAPGGLGNWGGSGWIVDMGGGGAWGCSVSRVILATLHSCGPYLVQTQFGATSRLSRPQPSKNPNPQLHARPDASGKCRSMSTQCPLPLSASTSPHPIPSTSTPTLPHPSAHTSIGPSETVRADPAAQLPWPSRS